MQQFQYVLLNFKAIYIIFIIVRYIIFYKLDILFWPYAIIISCITD